MNCTYNVAISYKTADDHQRAEDNNGGNGGRLTTNITIGANAVFTISLFFNQKRLHDRSTVASSIHNVLCMGKRVKKVTELIRGEWSERKRLVRVWDRERLWKSTCLAFNDCRETVLNNLRTTSLLWDLWIVKLSLWNKNITPLLPYPSHGIQTSDATFDTSGPQRRLVKRTHHWIVLHISKS